LSLNFFVCLFACFCWSLKTGNELNEILVNLGNLVIRGVDLNKISLGICDYCKKPIIVEVSETNGIKYHPEHLFCSRCKQPTSAGKFYEHNGQVFCVTCFEGRYKRLFFSIIINNRR
jgi:hypothetical protein